MEEVKSMQELITEIRKVTEHQKSASRADEVLVMRTMLNDPNFEVSIYDRNKGLIGTRTPREEAVKFIGGISAAVTGLDTKSAMELANGYEFTKKDAMFLIENSRDFTRTYLSTGRKLPIIQSEDAEAAIFCRKVDPKTKSIPAANGDKKTTPVPGFTKVVCKSKCPKYV